MKSLELEKDKIKTSIKTATDKQNTVGSCPKCGKDMIIRVSKNRKRFVGCTGFPSCKNTYSLPQKGGIITTDHKCKTCNSPIVKVTMTGKKPWSLCLNSDCPSKTK
jgi:DNA topoisomerase-1